MIGLTVSHYKIQKKIGDGGMGVVYKAEDIKLKRIVALKFLPESSSRSESAKKRFMNEAQAASALDHNNICTIYEIDETKDGQMFIVMAYYKGETLKEKIENRPCKIVDTLNISIQIGEGLTKAHEKNIVHRDLKPANLMVTDDDVVKIMDFGLAKLRGQTKITKERTILGTVAYMSPEQVRGDHIDLRSDIWSFGVVLYEMLTGKLPFAGEYEQGIIYSILNEDPEPPTTLRTGLPMELERILLKALAKDPDERYQHVNEMLVDLKSLHRQLENQSIVTDSKSVVPERSIGNIPKLTSYGALLVAAVAIIFYVWPEYNTSSHSVTSNKPSDPLQTFSVTGDEPSGRIQFMLRQATFDTDLEEYPAFSPDGRQIAYSREASDYKHIFIKNLETGTISELTNEASDDIQSTWSPDGNHIAFVRANHPSGKVGLDDIYGTHHFGDIWSIEPETGKEKKLIEEAFNPAYSPDGSQIAFDASWAGTRRVWIADNMGRNAQQITFDPSEEVMQINPKWSPDGSKIVFQNIEKTKFDVKVVNVNSRTMISITDDAFQDINPVWSSAGDVIYFSSYRSGGRNIWSISVNENGEPTGTPQQLTTGAGEDVQIAISPDGRKLAFSILKLNADLWRLPVSSETGRRKGPPEAVVSSTREDSRGAWSPDEKMIAFNSDRTGEMNIWVHRLDDGSEWQLTKGMGGDYQPHWSPDGKRITFFSSRSGNSDIWSVEVRSEKLQQLTDHESLEMNPFYSPDGNHIAYQSDLGGRREVWVMNSDGSKQRRLTNAGVGTSHYFMWTCDSKHVIFRNLTKPKMAMIVPISGGEARLYTEVAAGGHMSFSPDCSMIIDNDHKNLWLSSPGEDDRKIFSFDDPEIRIDYSVWSPSGKWILFDRLKPQGGDIWIMENFES